MDIKEIKLKELNPKAFITEQVESIRKTVGDGIGVVALSGGVDSSVVTMLGHRALGSRLKPYFIENGIMRAGEPKTVVATFKKLGVPVELVDARAQFFHALMGITDPEQKREVITQTFYKVEDILARTKAFQYLAILHVVPCPRMIFSRAALPGRLVGTRR
jgi:GMP synthase (glutamine-hydrolysing)